MAESNVSINNLCSWPLYFKRINGQGDIKIPANAKGYRALSYDEALAQIQNRNSMFLGTDGFGSHARIQIADESQRKSLFGLEADDRSEVTVLDAESVQALLAIRTKEKFHERLNELVKTDAERRMLVELAFQNGAEEASTWKVDALRALVQTETES